MELYKDEYNLDGTRARYYWDAMNEKMTVRHTYDCGSILQQNKQAQIGTLDRRFGNEMLHHVAEIPNGVVIKLKREHDIDVFSNDPDQLKRLLRLLDDPEYKYLKTTVKGLSRVLQR
jgi:hypothetical protein